jgi:outer membrane protein assembly factor BamB
MPLATLVLAFTSVLLADVLEPGQQFLALSSIILLTPLLLALWLMFFSGLRWWHRFALLGCAILLLAGAGLVLSQLLRPEDSISGDGVQRRLKARWSQDSREARPDLVIDTQDQGAGEVDLSVQGDRDYPQFLGRDRDGAAHGVQLARDWKAQPPEQLWRQSIGQGWSAFAIAGEYAVTQEQRGDKELVVCYELKTGKPRWKHEHDTRFLASRGGEGPRATPTIVGDRVYTVGGTGILDCIDSRTGKNIWSHDTLAENKLANLVWGKACSPMVFDDKVIVTGGKTNEPSGSVSVWPTRISVFGLWEIERRHYRPSLLAYHKDTGELLWKGGEDEAAYSSPTLAVLAGTRQILSVNAHSLTGHAPADGKVLWHFDWPDEGIPARASQPVPLPGDRVFVSAGYGVGCTMLQISKGADGTLTAETLWHNRNMRTQFSNVVITRNCAFGLDEHWLACVDLDTGERRWKGGRYEHGQVMLVGDVLVVQAEKGEVALVEANPDEFKELGRLPALKSKTWSNPALAGRYLLVRNDEEAVCYELPVQEGKR